MAVSLKLCVVHIERYLHSTLMVWIGHADHQNFYGGCVTKSALESQIMSASVSVHCLKYLIFWYNYVHG